MRKHRKHLFVLKTFENIRQKIRWVLWYFDKWKLLNSRKIVIFFECITYWKLRRYNLSQNKKLSIFHNNRNDNKLYKGIFYFSYPVESFWALKILSIFHIVNHMCGGIWLNYEILKLIRKYIGYLLHVHKSYHINKLICSSSFSFSPFSHSLCIFCKTERSVVCRVLLEGGKW